MDYEQNVLQTSPILANSTSLTGHLHPYVFHFLTLQQLDAYGIWGKRNYYRKKWFCESECIIKTVHHSRMSYVESW